MPRARSLFPVALSIEAASKAIKCPTRLLRDAVYVTRELMAFRGPIIGRVMVRGRDLEDFIERTWPRATIIRKISK